MPDYLVVLQAAWIVRRAKSVEDAMNIAVAEAGKRLNPDLNFVKIDVGNTACPKCESPLKAVFMVSGVALVGLVLEMKVFNAKSAEHAAKIAKYEVGKRMPRIPLDVIEVTEIV